MFRVREGWNHDALTNIQRRRACLAGKLHCHDRLGAFGIAQRRAQGLHERLWSVVEHRGPQDHDRIHTGFSQHHPDRLLERSRGSSRKINWVDVAAMPGSRSSACRDTSPSSPTSGSSTLAGISPPADRPAGLLVIGCG